MKFYRLKHKPTGLYYCPNRHVKNSAGEYQKSNLSKKGKVYHRPPTIAMLPTRYYTHLIPGSGWKRDVTLPIVAGEWEVEEWEVATENL